MCDDIKKLEEELKQAEYDETDAYGTYMYYECADRGYDYAAASKACDDALSNLNKLLNEEK